MLLTTSHLVPVGTLWAILTTFTTYLLVILSMAASTSHGSLLRNPDIVQDTSLYAPTILAGELAVTFFSALMGVVGAARLMQALARDKLFPGLFLFGRGTKRNDEPFAAVFLTYLIAQVALLADLDQLASLISIFYMVSYAHALSLCLSKFRNLAAAGSRIMLLVHGLVGEAFELVFLTCIFLHCPSVRRSSSWLMNADICSTCESSTTVSMMKKGMV